MMTIMKKIKILKMRNKRKKRILIMKKIKFQKMKKMNRNKKVENHQILIKKKKIKKNYLKMMKIHSR